MKAIYISGMGSYHPEGRLTNDDLVGMVDTSHEWIIDHTGIQERRRAADGELASDLGAVATREALAAAGWEPDDLDLIIVATSSPDTMIPPTACHLARKLGSASVAFDVNGACAGFAYGLATARSFMTDMGHRRVALCCAEKYTGFTDYTDRSTCVLFGDGAATVLLESEKPARGAQVVDILLRNDHRWTDLVTVPVGGYFKFAGRKLKEPAGGMLVDNAMTMLERHDLKASDLRAFVGHQANYRLLQTVGKQIGVTEEQHWSNVRMMGNQGSAGVLTTLCTGIQEHAADLRDGDLFLLSVVGSGLTSGCVLRRWTTSD